MAKKIHVRPSKSQSKIGFIAGIIFCLIGVFVAIPTFGLFGIVWTIFAGLIAYSHYRNGFTDKPIDTKVIEIDEAGQAVTVTTHTGLGKHSYHIDGDSVGEAEEKESVEERLKQLTNLYVQSLITREEYEQKKKEILDDL